MLYLHTIRNEASFFLSVDKLYVIFKTLLRLEKHECANAVFYSSLASHLNSQ